VVHAIHDLQQAGCRPAQQGSGADPTALQGAWFQKPIISRYG
jgi:hypothetical protein